MDPSKHHYQKQDFRMAITTLSNERMYSRGNSTPRSRYALFFRARNQGRRSCFSSFADDFEVSWMVLLLLLGGGGGLQFRQEQKQIVMIRRILHGFRDDFQHCRECEDQNGVGIRDCGHCYVHHTFNLDLSSFSVTE